MDVYACLVSCGVMLPYEWRNPYPPHCKTTFAFSTVLYCQARVRMSADQRIKISPDHRLKCLLSIATVCASTPPSLVQGTQSAPLFFWTTANQPSTSTESRVSVFLYRPKKYRLLLHQKTATRSTVPNAVLSEWEYQQEYAMSKHKESDEAIDVLAFAEQLRRAEARANCEKHGAESSSNLAV